MIKAFFVSDLHGKKNRYEALSRAILKDTPQLLFIGGDILPGGRSRSGHDDFILDYLFQLFNNLKLSLGINYPEVYLIMGNDDPRIEEQSIIKGDKLGYWHYIHKGIVKYKDFTIYGYAHVPPTPFFLKDWERYDVSRYVDVGAVDPLTGYHTVDFSKDKIEYYTIAKDLQILTKDHNLDKSIFLFHTPPYQTNLDRAALDGKMVDYAPLDVHVGSIAVKRFIENRKPYLTLHGHIHESSEITGQWKDEIGNTQLYTAAWNQEGLALIIFDLENLDSVERIILK